MSYANPTPDEKPTRMRVVLAVILFITLLVSYLDRVNVSILVADPKFLADMGITGQTMKMGLPMSYFLFAYGLSNLVAGPVGRCLGPRKAMSFAILSWVVATIVGGLAGSFAMLLGARVLLGLGEGQHWPMQSSFVKNWFPVSERAKANSAWLLGTMVGPMLSMPAISTIVAHGGWRISFWFLAVIGLIPLALVWFFSADHPRDSRFVNAAEREEIERGLLAEKRTGAESHGHGWRFLSDYRYWLVVLGFFASAAMFWGTMAWMPSYLHTARGFSWAQMGVLSSLPFVLGAVCLIGAGVIGDRVRNKAVISTISLVGAAGSLYLSATVSDNTASAYALAATLGFIGFGLASYWTIMQGIIAEESVGAAAGIMNGVASFGSAFVPAIVGFMIATGGGYIMGLLFLVGLGAFGGVCMAVMAARHR